MSVIDRILVPTDFSMCSEAAALTAAGLAKILDAKIILLHVVDMPDYGDITLSSDVGGSNLEKLATELASENMNRLTQKSEFEGLNMQVEIKSGSIYKAILEESQAIKVDLIIMGTHGHAGINKYILGSTTQKVVRFSNTPVLTVQQELKVDAIKNIAFASTFNQEYTFTFPKVFQLMQLFNARLHLLKVVTPRNFETTAYNDRIIEDFATEFCLNEYNAHIVNAHSIEEGLEWFCQQNGIDLLFMTTHGHKGLNHILFGSHTEKMAQQYQCPVLSVRMTKVKNPRGVIFPD